MCKKITVANSIVVKLLRTLLLKEGCFANHDDEDDDDDDDDDNDDDDDYCY
jgi:hypothetical protein